MQLHLLEVGSTQNIFIRTRTYRIESHCREYIPGRSLAVVLITAITVGSRGIKFVHHFTNPMLRFPGLAGIVVHIEHVLNRLVAMCIVAHVHNLHFTDFMNNGSIITFIENRRKDKYRIHHLVESVFTSHQVNQTLRIVEYRPGIMPAITFRKGIPPLQRIERRLERTVFILATHQFVLGIVEILIIHCTLCKDFNLFFRFLQGFTQLIDTPVIVCIFQCTGCILVNTYIIRYISQFIVILMS